MAVGGVECQRDGVALWAHLDAPPLNLLDVPRIRALREAYATACEDAALACFVLRAHGRALTGGLDTRILAAGGSAAESLLAEMGELLLELFAGRVPVVCVTPGHAVAAGAMLLLVSDVRVGAEGQHRIGFSEVRQGLPLPALPVLLARDRLQGSEVERATLQAHLFAPEAARSAGFLDEVVEPEALDARARRAVEDLAPLADAYAASLTNVRGPTLARLSKLVEAQRERLRAATS